MSQLLDSIRAEYRRYQTLAERALDQVPEALLSVPGPGGSNSLTVIAWHLAGNLRSRFTAFLTEDGEKSWRNRDDEFVARVVSREELLAQWRSGWATLYNALDELTDGDLQQTVTIRGQALHVHDALHRSLAHASYHVGQIVYLAHAYRGADWEYLSIPPGGSAAYNAAPPTPRNLASISPFFIVRDLPASIAYYLNHLGFTLDFQGPKDDVYYAHVSREGMGIMLKVITPEVGPVPNHTQHAWARWDAYIYANDPDALFAEFKQRGATFVKELSWIDEGLWGFEVADADGYVIAFFRTTG